MPTEPQCGTPVQAQGRLQSPPFPNRPSGEAVVSSPAEALPPPPPRPLPSPSGTAEVTRVLLIEDQVSDALLIREALARVSGWRCQLDHVTQLGAGLRRLAAGSFQAVLLDLNLPDSPPAHTLALVRAQEPHLPIVVLTGSEDEQLGLQLIQAGAQDYLVKGQANGPLLARCLRYAIERKQAEAVLRASESRYRALFEGATWGVYQTTPAGRITLANPALARMLGYGSPQELMAEVTDLAGQVYAEPRMRAEFVRDLQARGQLEGLEFRARRRDGNMIWVSANALCVRNGDGAVLHHEGTVEDISERKRAEEALRESRANLARAESFSGIMVTHLALDGRWLKVPALLSSLLGYPVPELLRMSIQQVSHPDDAQADWRQYQMLLHSDLKAFSSEKRFCTKAGAVLWFSVNTALVLNVHDQPEHFLTYLRDVTQSKHAEEQLRAQAALLDLTRDAISVRDLNGRLLYLNKGTEALYGWTAAQALEPEAAPLLCSDSGPTIQTCLEQALRDGHWSGDLEKFTKAGQKLIVQSRWTLLKNGSGVPQSVLIVETDITERKRIEAQFLRAQRLESVGQLAGGIAHDLNNILAPILMLAPLIRSELSSQDGRSWLDTIQASTQRGANIVKQLTLFARGVQGEKIPLQPRALIRDVANLIHETFPKAITLTTRFSEHLWTVLGDITQLHQVLLNLCVNARDAMPQGGALTLAADNVVLDALTTRMMPGAKPGPHVLFTVADTGTGIPAEIADKVFDPFFTTKAPEKGTGLGLSTVAAIVKGHGGFVTLTSELGRGSTFQVFLPADTATAVCPQPRTEAAPPRGTGQLILIVDDEESIRSVTEDALKSQSYRTLVAKDGTEAVAAYLKNQTEIALVLTDLDMPRQDGATTIQALRRLNPQVPIIVATGLDLSAEVPSASELGVQARLKKPFHASDLLETVSEVLQSSPAHRRSASSGGAGLDHPHLR